MADQFNLDDLGDDVDDSELQDSLSRLKQLEQIGKDSRSTNNLESELESKPESQKSRYKTDFTADVLKNIRDTRKSSQEKLQPEQSTSKSRSPFLKKSMSAIKMGSAFFNNPTILGAAIQIKKQLEQQKKITQKKTPFNGKVSSRTTKAKNIGARGAAAKLRRAKQAAVKQERAIDSSKTIGKQSGTFLGKVATRAGKFTKALFNNSTIGGSILDYSKHAEQIDEHHGIGNSGVQQPAVGVMGSTSPNITGTNDFLYQDNLTDQAYGSSTAGSGMMPAGNGFGDKNVGSLLSRIYQVLSATNNATSRIADDIAFIARNTRAGQTQSDLFNANVKARINEHPEQHARVAAGSLDHHDLKHDEHKDDHGVGETVKDMATGAVLARGAKKGVIRTVASGAARIATRAAALAFAPEVLTGLAVTAGAVGATHAYTNSFGKGGFELIQRLEQTGIIEHRLFEKSKILKWEEINKLSIDELKILLKTGEFNDSDNEKIRKLIQKKLGVSATPDYEKRKQNAMIQEEPKVGPHDEDSNPSMRKPESLWDKVTSFFEPGSMKSPSGAPKSTRAPKRTIEPSPSDQTLGSSTKRYESGSKGANAIGYDKAGGTSYGSYQIASNTGTMNSFLKHLEDTGKGDVASELRSAGPANTGGKSGAFVDKWQEMVNSGRLTSEDEHNFIQKTHYDPAASKAKELGFKMEDSGVKDAIWSGSVQHGGINTILERTAKKTPGFENMSAEDQIKAYYKERGAYAKENGVDQEERYSSEQQSVLAKSKYAAEHPNETAKPILAQENTSTIDTEQKPQEPLKTAALNAPTAITEKPNDFENLKQYVSQQSAGQQKTSAAQSINSPNQAGYGSKMMNVRNDDPVLLTLQYGNVRTT
jgi:hypothetical protein